MQRLVAESDRIVVGTVTGRAARKSAGVERRNGLRARTFKIEEMIRARRSTEHWQVTGGGQGEFLFEGDKLQAPFSLEDVREAATQAPPK